MTLENRKTARYELVRIAYEKGGSASFIHAEDELYAKYGSIEYPLDGILDELVVEGYLEYGTYPEYYISGT